MDALADLGEIREDIRRFSIDRLCICFIARGRGGPHPQPGDYQGCIS